jgi:hypothetical protein
MLLGQLNQRGQNGSFVISSGETRNIYKIVSEDLSLKRGIEAHKHRCEVLLKQVFYNMFFKAQNEFTRLTIRVNTAVTSKIGQLSNYRFSSRSCYNWLFGRKIVQIRRNKY